MQAFEVRTCPGCGRESATSASRCAACGRPLTGEQAAHLPEGERKTITVLFADIKGSMDLLEELDPEEARSVIDPALRLMVDSVRRYEGHVAQTLGDGIFALFGAPLAHEDHPQRALYAALAMQEEMRKYARALRLEKGLNLEIRVGVNTGEVVAHSIEKDELRADYAPIGHATSLAARLQTLAFPGTIVVSGATRKLVEERFQFRTLGPTKIKGVSRPVELYEVTGIGTVRTRLELAERRGLLRFVGRDRELSEMRRLWTLAREGHGQIVAVMGDPGVGKSRLLYEFRHTLPEGTLVLEAFAVSHGKAYPYLPVVELLKGYLRITPRDDADVRREKLTAKLLALDRSLEPTLPYLFPLLEIPDASTMALQQMDAELRRRRTRQGLTRLFLKETVTQTVVLFVEDLHWLDGESEAFLTELGETLGSARLLLVASHRPEYEDRWGKKTYFTRLRLDPLAHESASEILESLLGGAPELEPLKRLIIQEAEGNPFFIEEIVRELFERGILVRNGSVELTRPVREIRIPPTIQGVLAARIDRLGAVEKEVVQSAAVVGRGFTLALVEAVTGRSAEDLREMLTRLQRAELVYERPAFPESEYTFKHALTREVAYESVLIERRKLLHERAAQAIERLYADRLEERYSELAYHYSHSGNVDKAVEYLRLAGEKALRRSAHAEGIELFQRALELLAALPETSDRDRRELDLQLALGPGLISRRGEAADEVERTYRRARDLCLAIGDRPRLFPILWGLWLFNLLRAQYSPARELAGELLLLARELGEQSLLVPAHLASAMTHQFLGGVRLALEHAERAVAEHDPAKHASQAFVYSLDPGVHSLCYTALARWSIGRPDEAVATVGRAVSLADRLALPYVQAIAYFFSALVRLLRREPEAAEAPAEKCVSISKDLGFPQWLAGGGFIRAWALSEQGRTEEALDQLIAATEAGRDAEVRQMTPWAFSLMAEQDARAARMAEEMTQRDARSTTSWVPFPRSSTGPSISLIAGAAAKGGRIEEGLSKLEQAIAVAEGTGERWWDAELHRLRGELLLQIDPAHQEAEACFRRAVQIARDQESRSLELRATTSLCRFLASKGKADEGRTALADIYSSFTEGFDTPDLREARALLEALRSGTTGRGAASAVAEPGDDVNVFRKEGDFWTIAYAGKVSRLRDAKGIRCIAHLLRHPGKEFHVIELASTIEGVAPTTAPEKGQILEAGLGESRLGEAEDVLDPRARAEYRTRLAELREELAEAERFNDLGRAERLREEIEALTRALAAAVGPGGRTRKLSSPAERARVNLTKTLHDALARLARDNPALGRHLRATLRTGYVFRYEPDPASPITWRL